MIEAALYSFLTGLSGLSDVGTRIEPAMNNQTTTLPRIRYTRVAEPNRVFSNSGFANLSQVVLQADIIASTYTQAKTLAAVIQDEDGYTGNWNADWEVQLLRVDHVRDVPQPAAGGATTSPYMVQLELTVWHQARS
jgi:hypothetical protein